ncbi:type II toxin-antitoxin system RelE/ParE family toxin [Rhodoferax sp. U2-2l]|nr:type II toxin-antitoxin system RelE/ParE family toxin [Rhodoferax sp. U2-2l]
MAWSIAFTSDFRKSVADIDKKLQGRILEVISNLSQDPLTAQGDTKKPLTGEFKGLWRYRIGEYRLVYEPVLADQQVVLLEFASRGSIYQQ